MTVAHAIHSATCPTCAELCGLQARNEEALQRARKLLLAALRSEDGAAAEEMEEELKQTAAARKIIAYTLEAHRARFHASAAVALAA